MRLHRKCPSPEGATAADALASRAAVAPYGPGCSDAPQRAAQGTGGGEGETNDAPRRPKPPLPGKRPAPLEEVAERQEKLGQHSGIG